MISFKEASIQAGYDRNKKPPVEKVVWYAYSARDVREYPTKEDAMEFSKLVERAVINKAEIDAFWEERRELEQKAVDIWYNVLLEYHSNLSAEVFSIVYSKAYENVHSDGYDAVASEMEELAIFAERILKAK